jgi:hypothetical protein
MLAVSLSGTPAQALAARTWVSGVGDDSFPCTRLMPCKTFAGAESKTAAGGEIDVLDPGGFDAVTIVKSLTIVNEGAIGGVLVSGTNAIVVNAGASDVVTLRGLDINGDGTGLGGIVFNSGAALHVEHCLIRHFQAPGGVGIAFQPSGASELSVSETIVTENGSGTGQGIRIAPTVGGTASVVLNRVEVVNNFSGISASSANSSTVGRVIDITVRDSVAAGNTNFGIVARSTAEGHQVFMMLDRVSSDFNATGVEADGSSAIIAMSGSTVTGNSTGLSSLNGGILGSYQNNNVIGNVTNGVPTSTLTPE